MKKNQGFSMLEAMIVLVSSVVLILGMSRVIKALLTETSKVQIQQQGLFYEEFIIEKVTAQLGTLLFWVSNVEKGCEHARELLRGTFKALLPPRCETNGIDNCTIDFTRHLKEDEDQNKISFLDNLTGGNNDKQSLAKWYNDNMALKGKKDRIWDAIDECSNSNSKSNSKILEVHKKDNFKYCLLIESNAQPGKRLDLINETIKQKEKTTLNRDITKIKQNSFYFAVIDATFFELIKNENIICVDNTHFMGKLNRTIKVNINLYGVENIDNKQNEKKMMLTKSIFIPKSEREVININKKNCNDPAWLFENKDPKIKCP